jgi:signal peptidase II
MLPYILILLAFLADRLSKWWAISYLDEHGPTRINALFSVQETYNRGIAFGMFQGIGPLVGWLTIAVVVGMLIYLVRLPKEEKLLQIGLALLIGGALGNLVDRIMVGKVLDFIVTPLRSGVFNVADVVINLGIIIILLTTAWSALRSHNQNLAEVPPSGQNG